MLMLRMRIKDYETVHSFENKYEKGKKKYIVKSISDAEFSYKTITPDNYTSNEETQVNTKTTKSK